MPSLVLFSIRWMNPSSSSFPMWSYPNATLDISFTEAMSVSMTVYIIWQILYYYIILVKRGDKVFDGSRATSFTWLLSDYMKNKPNSWQTKLMVSVGPKYHVFVFMLFNLIFAILTVIPTFLFYKSIILHSIFMISILTMSIFNGADYYIEVFSKRYRSEVDRLDSFESSDECSDGVLSAIFDESGIRGKKKNDKWMEEIPRQPRRLSVQDVFAAKKEE